MTKNVFGIPSSKAQLEEIREELKRAGFSGDEIRVVASDQCWLDDDLPEAPWKEQRSAVHVLDHGVLALKAREHVVGALRRLGVPLYEAELYERKIQQGNTVISIPTPTRAEALRAREVLEKVGVGYITLGRGERDESGVAAVPHREAACC
jgi:hypothetical protein